MENVSGLPNHAGFFFHPTMHPNIKNKNFPNSLLCESYNSSLPSPSPYPHHSDTTTNSCTNEEEEQQTAKMRPHIQT